MTYLFPEIIIQSKSISHFYKYSCHQSYYLRNFTDMDRNKRITKPKYEIIKEALLERIRTGQFSSDAVFCTEKCSRSNMR